MDFEAHIVFIWMLLKKSLACFLVKQFAEMFPLLPQLRPERDGSTHGARPCSGGPGARWEEAPLAQRTPLHVARVEVGEGQWLPEHPWHHGAIRARQLPRGTVKLSPSVCCGQRQHQGARVKVRGCRVPAAASPWASLVPASPDQ